MALDKDEDFSHREQPDNGDKEIDTIEQVQAATGEPCQAGRFVDPDHRNAKTKADCNGSLCLVVRAKPAKRAKSQKIEGEIFRRAEHKGDPRQQRRQQHQPDGGEKSPDKGGDTGQHKRITGTPGLGHRIAIQRRHHRRFIARYVQQD